MAAASEEAAAAALLLLKADYHPGCPGCAFDRKKELRPGMPYKEFLYIWMICLTAGVRFGGSPSCFDLSIYGIQCVTLSIWAREVY